jgi:hypothetical protein
MGGPLTSPDELGYVPVASHPTVWNFLHSCIHGLEKSCRLIRPGHLGALDMEKGRKDERESQHVFLPVRLVKGVTQLGFPASQFGGLGSAASRAKIPANRSRLVPGSASASMQAAATARTVR